MEKNERIKLIRLKQDMDIDELEFSVRTYNCLKRAGINTVNQLLDVKDEELMSVRNLGLRGFEEIKDKLAEFAEWYSDEEYEEIDYYAQLNALIGLAEVKKQVEKIAALARMKKDLESRVPIVLNMEFSGNPGTAKTTVARILAGLLYQFELLKSPEIVEVGRADLVARYVGQTADKVKCVFERAKGRLLFIDEAYSLLECHEGEFGDEAINTIVQEMENNRDKTVVIFAGYPDEMKEFFARNPGLRSRVPFQINFNDYSADEMIQIAKKEAADRGFKVDKNAVEEIHTLCEKARKNTNAGNGRFCRNLIENAIMNYALRVYGKEDESRKNGKRGNGKCENEKQQVNAENAGTESRLSEKKTGRKKTDRKKDFVLRKSDFQDIKIISDNRPEAVIGFRR